jgi:hypothetical protein
MGFAAIIVTAVALQYVNDLAKGSFTPKPLIGGGIVLLMLSGVSEGISPKLANIMAWLILLAVLLNGHSAIGAFFVKAGNPAAVKP